MTDSLTLTEWVQAKMNGYTEADLEFAFDCVKDLTNWKLPINVTVGTSVTRLNKELIATAIEFYTGSVAEFTDNEDGSYTVTATGYYEACC